MRLTVVATCLSFCLIGISVADDAHASIRKEINIPAEGLGVALQTLAKDRNFQIVYVSEEIDDIRTQGAVGEFTPEEALKRLLTGTGLTFRYLDDKTVTIQPAKVRAAARAADDPPEEGKKKDSSDGFRVAQVDQGQAAGAVSVARDKEGEKPLETKQEKLEEIVVTGTAGGASQLRQETSYQITKLSSDQIDQAAPKSAAELLQLVPGVWVEASGGVNGANMNVEGFPEAGDSPHVTWEINGAPIYGTESLPWMGQDTLFRIDETIQSVEAVIGGSGAVFARGEPGLTVNTRLKEGSDQTDGLIQYSTSDYHLQRVDAVLSGKLADGFYYMVGGFVSNANGPHDPGFQAEKGQQFTINLTKYLENGKIDLWTRNTDDHGQFLGEMCTHCGLNLGTYTPLNSFTRNQTFQTGVTAGGNPIYSTADAGQGRGWKGSISGLNAEFSPAQNITLRDKLSYTSGQVVSNWIQSYGDNGVQVSALGLPPGSVATVNTHRTLGPIDWINVFGFDDIQKQIRSVSNDLSFEFKTGDVNDLTLGYYASQWSADDLWYQGSSPFVLQVAPAGDYVNLPCSTVGSLAQVQANAGGNPCQFGNGQQATSDASAEAFYLADSFHISDALRLDGGLRHERETFEFHDINCSSGFPNPTGTGCTIQIVPHFTTSKYSYTGAADYSFSHESAAYARFTQGYAWPGMSAFQGAAVGPSPQVITWAPTQSIKLAEAGYKHSALMWTFYGTAFYNKTDSIAGLNGVPAGYAPTFITTRAYGTVLESELRTGQFSIRTHATLQKAKYLENSGDLNSVGRQVMRQPDARFMVTPAYDLLIGDWMTTFNGSLTYIGSRKSDQDGTFTYPAYTTIDAGLTTVYSPLRVSIKLYGKNLTNRLDYTEDAGFYNAGATPPVYARDVTARPILGRTLHLIATYKF